MLVKYLFSLISTAWSPSSGISLLKNAPGKSIVVSSDLTQLGYKVNPSDICVFNRTELDSTQTTLVIHVDDMMISSRDEKHIDNTILEIERLYPGLTKSRGRVLNYTF